MKVTLTEIKNNPQETNTEGTEAGIQNNNSEHKEEINSQPNRMKKQEFKKTRRIKRLWDISKSANIQITGVSAGEEEEQEIENLFEKIMKESFPNLAKEIDVQVQEAQKVPNNLDPKKNTPRHIRIKMPDVKDKGRILKTAREKETVTYRGVPMRLSADFSKETLQASRDWQEVFQVMKGKGLHPRLLLSLIHI